MAAPRRRKLRPGEIGWDCTFRPGGYSPQAKAQRHVAGYCERSQELQTLNYQRWLQLPCGTGASSGAHLEPSPYTASRYSLNAGASRQSCTFRGGKRGL